MLKNVMNPWQALTRRMQELDKERLAKCEQGNHHKGPFSRLKTKAEGDWHFAGISVGKTRDMRVDGLDLEGCHSIRH
jgi:hypothetical protein